MEETKDQKTFLLTAYFFATILRDIPVDCSHTPQKKLNKQLITNN